MIMSDNKKKSVSLILEKMKGAKEGPTMEAAQNDDAGEVDNSVGIDSAAEEIMQAVESKDAKALVSALKSFIDMHDEQQPEEQAQESSEE